MDKRSLIFVVSLSLTLFVVNTFFQYQRRDELKEWNLEQIQKKEKQLSSLKETVLEKSIERTELPLGMIYSDQKKTKSVNTAILSKGYALTLSWTEKLPETIFITSTNDPEGKEYFLTAAPQEKNVPVLYSQTKGEALFPVTPLSEFGSYTLQILPLDPKEQTEKPFLGTYEKGILTVPQKEIVRLSQEINQESPSVPSLENNGIAFLKSTEGYLPVAFYNGARSSLIFLEDLPGLAPFLSFPEVKEEAVAGTEVDETFYVIENDYMQLVFSNIGGALAEINLPFESETNQRSVVQEIGFDRDMVEQHPYNALFPAHPYYTAPAEENGSPERHPKGTLGNYYPLIRRDLVRTQTQSVKIPPEYYALNIVSSYPEMARVPYKMVHFDKQSITFEVVQKHRKIVKRYSVGKETKDAPYCLQLSITVEGDNRGLWLTSAVPEVEWISNTTAPTIKYRITRNEKGEVDTISLPKESFQIGSTYPDWICNSNGFFGLILDPLTPVDPGLRADYVSGKVVPSRLVEIDQGLKRFTPEKLPGYQVLLPLRSGSGTVEFRIFAGPLAKQVLSQVDNIFRDPETGQTPDYMATRSFHGWFSFISEPFAKFLFLLLNLFHSLTSSWAFSIVLLTIAVRLMLYPLNAWSTKSMLRMQQIQPEVNALQKKYKKEPQKMQLELMNLYRERGVNPLSGCFPMIIQIPFLFGMFSLLKSSFALRGASFIPGWIDNLAAPDVLFSWTTPIFFIGNQFHLLPILLGGLMFIQQRFMSKGPANPEEMTDQQKQQKTMGNMMAIVFTFMFYNFPSGLNIYWLSSTLLGMLQQWWTSKNLKKFTSPPKSTKTKAR